MHLKIRKSHEIRAYVSLWTTWKVIISSPGKVFKVNSNMYIYTFTGECPFNLSAAQATVCLCGQDGCNGRGLPPPEVLDQDEEGCHGPTDFLLCKNYIHRAYIQFTTYSQLLTMFADPDSTRCIL